MIIAGYYFWHEVIIIFNILVYSSVLRQVGVDSASPGLEEERMICDWLIDGSG